MDAGDPTFAYDGFISYRHLDDADLAEKLQAALHRLAKSWWRRSSIRVFRDKTSLSASAGVTSSLHEALSRSRWLILLASPASAASIWVRREVEWWVANRAVSNILLVLTAGNIIWDREANDFSPDVTDCLPTALYGRFAEEPNHVDLRWATDRSELGLRHLRFRAAVLDLAAPLHGKPKDELDSEDLRQTRRARYIIRAGVSAICLLGVAASVAAYLALLNASAARRSEAAAISRQHAAESQLALRDGRLRASFVSAWMAWERDQTPEARAALFETWLAAAPIQSILEGIREVRALAFDTGDNGLVIRHGDPRLLRWMPGAEATLLFGGTVPLGGGERSIFSSGAQFLAVGDLNGAIRLHDVATGSLRASLDPTSEGPLTALTFCGRGGRLLTVRGADAVEFIDISSEGTTQALPPADHALTRVTAAACSMDGKFAAVAAGENGVVWEVASGTPLSVIDGFSANAIDWISALAFQTPASPLADEVPDLLLGHADGGLSRLSRGETSSTRVPQSRHEDRVVAIASSPDWTATIARDGRLFVSPQSSGTSVDLSWSGAPLLTLAHDGRRSAVGADDGTILIVNLGDPTELKTTVERHCGRALVSRFRPDGRVQVTLSGLVGGKRLIASGKLVSPAEAPRKVLSADGKLSWLDPCAENPTWTRTDVRLTGSIREALQLGDALLVTQTRPAGVWITFAAAQSGHQPSWLPLDQDVSQMVVSPDGRRVAVQHGLKVSVLDLLTRGWLLRDIALPKLSYGPGYTPEHIVAWAPDSRWLATGSDEEVRLADLSGTGRLPSNAAADLVNATWSQDGRWLLGQRPRQGWRLLDLRAGHARDFLPNVSRALLSPAGDRVAFITMDRRLLLLDARDPGANPVDSGIAEVRDLAFSPDGRWLAVERSTGLTLMDGRREKPPLQLQDAQFPVDFSADGRSAAVAADRAQRTLLLDLVSQQQRTLGGTSAYGIDDIAFSADGFFLFVVEANGAMAVWDAINARRLGGRRPASGIRKHDAYRLRLPSSDRVAGRYRLDLPYLASPQQWIDSLCARIQRVGDGIYPSPLANIPACTDTEVVLVPR